MNKVLVLLLTIWSTTSLAKVINFEIKFTPFIGNPATEDSVKSVAGKARIFLNNVLISEQEVQSRDQPVMFAEREIGAEVWLPVASLGPLVRQGKNTVKIEFVPGDNATPYRAQMSWAEVNDQSAETQTEGGFAATNQSGEGKDIKDAQGKVVMEREFAADFAADQSWHHAQAITTLGDDDKQQLLKLVNDRAEQFKPKFEGLYKLLAMPHPGIELDLAQIRKSGCLDKAYKAGVRIPARGLDQLEFMLSGGQEVVVKGKTDALYPLRPEDFAKIKGDETQMCAGMALSIAYPPQMIVVKNSAGAWEAIF